jgi:hypothetical protein
MGAPRVFLCRLIRGDFMRPPIDCRHARITMEQRRALPPVIGGAAGSLLPVPAAFLIALAIMPADARRERSTTGLRDERLPALFNSRRAFYNHSIGEICSVREK